MEAGRRRRLGKSPVIPIPRPPPFTVMAPTTLSKAFEMPSNSSFMSRALAASNTIVSPETKMVDLNVPLPLAEVNQGLLSPPRNRHSASPSAVQSAPSVTRRHIPTLDQALEKEMKDGCVSDPRKLRRTVSNRLSAQRSRMKKAQHMVEMEQKIKDLEDTIAILNPQIENYKNKQRALRIQKATLEQQLHNCITKSNLCNIQIEENQREVQRLKEVQEMQREQLTFASNFGRQQPPIFNMSGSHLPQLLPGSSFHQCYEEPADISNTDPAVVDQYINFDALNIQPN